MSLSDFWIDTAQQEVQRIGEAQEEALLALRSFLAYGLAMHCLCRRHRVKLRRRCAAGAKCPRGGAFPCE
jgi:hypothetical protein